MPKRRLRSHFFPVIGLLTLAATWITGWLVLTRLETTSLDRERDQLSAVADYLDRVLGPEFPQARADFAAASKRFAQASGLRITLIMPNGKVDMDTQGRPEEFDNQLTRPEIRHALAGAPQHVVRYNAGAEVRVMYLAVPLLRHDRTVGVLYLASPLAALDATMATSHIALAIASLVASAAATLLASLWFSRRFTRPIVQVRDAVRRLAEGQWGARAAVPDPRELAELAEAFNTVAAEIHQKLGLLTRQHNEQKAVFASMAEGVLAVDARERLISLNPASCELLGLDQAQARGRPLQELIRNADLSRFISRALHETEPIESDVLLHGNRQRVLQARGSALHDLDGRPIGAVIVLDDVTDFRRLEQVRRDFVANVSHELKTPITSIKGFVETLLDGAVQDPVDAERFLRIVAKQADRLHAIIEDLLSLSKIEQGEDREEIVLEEVSLSAILDSAVTACQTVAEERQIQVALACDRSLKAVVNPRLLEQAVVNLLDNAIKYSEPNHAVNVAAERAGDEVAIRVIDHGVGIAHDQQARIFERFYRVDRARSRKLGGTGLGLAIVKHIVHAHCGRITVDSELGAGSTFTIFLQAQLGKPSVVTAHAGGTSAD